MEILLTNDDGIDQPGLRALYESLSALGEVTAVAPTDDRSAVGRSMSSRVAVSEHSLGYAVDGTPADCVVAGLQVLSPGADLVVSGCNLGANLGAYVLGRSGTVSAAVEAAFFERPAIAVSMYVPSTGVDFEDFDPGTGRFDEAARAAEYLADHAVDAGVFQQADYLNVNVPMDERAPEMVVTEPSEVYDMDAAEEGEEIVLYDRIWERMSCGDVPDPPGTDRRAVIEGKMSVSPLTAPHTTHHHEALDGLAEAYDG
jgi:5'-nucleotidase